MLPGLLDHDEMCISEYYEPNEADALKRLVGWQSNREAHEYLTLGVVKSAIRMISA